MSFLFCSWLLFYWQRLVHWRTEHNEDWKEGMNIWGQAEFYRCGYFVFVLICVIQSMMEGMNIWGQAVFYCCGNHFCINLWVSPWWRACTGHNEDWKEVMTTWGQAVFYRNWYLVFVFICVSHSVMEGMNIWGQAVFYCCGYLVFVIYWCVWFIPMTESINYGWSQLDGYNFDTMTVATVDWLYSQAYGKWGQVTRLKPCWRSRKLFWAYSGIKGHLCKTIPLAFMAPIHYQALSYSSGTEHTVTIGTDRIWLHCWTASCVWWEQFMLDSYQTQHNLTVTLKSVIWQCLVVGDGLQCSFLGGGLKKWFTMHIPVWREQIDFSTVWLWLKFRQCLPCDGNVVVCHCVSADWMVLFLVLRGKSYKCLQCVSYESGVNGVTLCSVLGDIVKDNVLAYDSEKGKCLMCLLVVHFS